MEKLLGILCVCLCISVVYCQYGFFPSRQDRRHGDGYVNYVNPRRVTAQLAGILHLKPENQYSDPAYVYPFDRRPGITNPEGHQHHNGQNQYYPNQNQQYPNQFGQNQQYPNQFGQNQQYPNQFGQNQPYPNQFGQNQQYPNQFGQNQQYPNQFGQNQQYPNQFGQNQQYPNQIGQNQQYTPDGQNLGQNQNQNIPFGQNNENQNQGGQDTFSTSNPSQVNFVNNFGEPDPPTSNGQSGQTNNYVPTNDGQGGQTNYEDPNRSDVPVTQTELPQLTPVPHTELPQLTPVPQTALQQLTPVPEFEKRNNFNFGSAGLFQAGCTTVDNGVGRCISLLQCPPYLKVVQDSKSNPNAVQLLRRAHCGFEGNNPKVCCPLPGFPTVEKDTLAPPPLVTTTTTTPGPTAAPKTIDGDFVASLPDPPDCGVSNGTLSRVVGGAKAKLGDFPWMALLGYKSKRGTGARWLCGGSLVTSKHVLTAAHCIHGHEDDLFIVRLGELDLEREDEGATPVDVPIKSKLKHEEYSPTAFTNDIGVLVLEREVTFTDLIKPICIPKDSELRARSFENYNPIIAGWGDTEFQGPSASHLQVLQLPVVSNDFCAQAYTAYKKQKIDERVLCAGYKKGGRDACQGDSGGPLMQPVWNDLDHKTAFYQIGVVSFGRKCAEAGFPGVYSRVTHFVPWLEDKLLGTH